MTHETNPNGHSESVHPQVLAVLAHYGVTVEDYLLFTSGSIIPKNGEFPRALTDPVMEEDYELEVNETYEAAYAEFEDIFVENYLQELLDAKHTFIQELQRDDCNVEVKVDDDTLLDLDIDLPAVQTLGVSLEAMTVFEFQTAFEAGILMGERADEPEQLGRSLAIGYYLCPDPEAYERWLTVAMYSMGKAFYDVHDAYEVDELQDDDESFNEEVSLYEAVGVAAVQKQMEELIGLALSSDPQVSSINGQVFDGSAPIKDAVFWYESRATEREESFTGFYPDPEYVDESILALLDAHNVTWDELQFKLGGSIVPKLPAYLYTPAWFSDLLKSSVIDIEKGKNEETMKVLSRCADILGYSPDRIGFFSEWDLDPIKTTFDHGARLPSTKDNKLRTNWKEIERAASLPYIVNNAFEKAHIYLTLQSVLYRSGILSTINEHDDDATVEAVLNDFMQSQRDMVKKISEEMYTRLSTLEMNEIFQNGIRDRAIAYRIIRDAAERLIDQGEDPRGAYTSIYS